VGCVAGTAFAAPQIGTLIFSDGVITAQSPSEPVRVVAKSSPLLEGDVLTTSERSFGVIEFGDGARMTVRPNTTMVIARYNLTGTPQSENVVLQLFKGGLRAVTGAIGKRDPASVRIVTPTSTIGIRGTSFDARLCEGDCQGEKFKTSGQPTPPAQDVLARVNTVWGSGTITGKDAKQRRLAEGVALYPGDQVQTNERSAATLVFADQTRITLNANTRFEVSAFHYAVAERANKDSAPDSAIFKLWVGGLRLATGLIGKSHPENYKVRVATSTIGVRGTGFDLNCTGACADIAPEQSASGANVGSSGAGVSGACGNGTPIDPPPTGSGMFAATWDGVITLSTGDCNTVLSKGNAAVVNPKTGETTPLTRTPGFMDEGLAPRPDALTPDYLNLFGALPLQSTGYGLYTFVREGAIHIDQASGGAIDISPGQAGFADQSGSTIGRLSQAPSFILNDPYPLPGDFSESNQSVIDLVRENILGINAGALGRCSIR
jgi:hypothetical protein